LANEPLFIFGDFNFRLDLAAVIKHMTTKYHQPQFIRGDDGGLAKIVYHNPLAVSNDSLCIERRKFFLNSHSELFINQFHELIQFDREKSDFNSLKEFPIKFQPR
jgi:hypothetical protein